MQSLLRNSATTEAEKEIEKEHQSQPDRITAQLPAHHLQHCLFGVQIICNFHDDQCIPDIQQVKPRFKKFIGCCCQVIAAVKYIDHEDARISKERVSNKPGQYNYY